MKNQYVGDVGDYGKYSLLRFLANHGIKVGVNWFLTKNDGSTDGKFTDYLKEGSEKIYDPVVFSELKKIVDTHKRCKRTVQMVQDTGLIPNAMYFDEELKSHKTSPLERAWERRLWYKRSISDLQDVDLVFADPDNGITYKKTARLKDSIRYVLPEEIAQYYYSGKDVVYYCHKGRRTCEEWNKAKTQILESVHDARIFVLTYHKGTQRSYIFVIHPERAKQYESLLTEFISDTEWGKNKKFTRECVIEIRGKLPPDICAGWAVINYFQKPFRTKVEKEKILHRMSNAEIDELINAAHCIQAKIFYSSFKK
ncbi:MAG: hypothetical protein IJK56_00960 [Firmicutes bacterium]|nr:hypothetical protein [Bacillota bacterium]